MSGHADLKKRNIVHKMLRMKRWQQSSDNAVATAAHVSRYLVAEIRSLMLADGSHPPLDAADRDIRARRLPDYRTGRSARGGYVYDAKGKAIRETEWLRQRAKQIGGKVGRTILELLEELSSLGSPSSLTPPARRPRRPRPAPSRRSRSGQRTRPAGP